jgi:hypothetical protein
MAAFRIELLHRSDEHREQRHDLYAPDIAAAVVQASLSCRLSRQALVGQLPNNGDGLIAYEARKGDLA